MKYQNIEIKINEKDINLFMQKDIDKKNLVLRWIYKYRKQKRYLKFINRSYLSKFMKWYNLYIKIYLSRIIKTYLQEKLKYLRKYRIKL